MMPSWLNISTRKVGGLRFIKVGRLCVSFCITRRYRDINQPKHPKKFRTSHDGVLVLGFTNE